MDQELVALKGEEGLGAGECLLMKMTASCDGLSCGRANSRDHCEFNETEDQPPPYVSGGVMGQQLTETGTNKANGTAAGEHA